ncbi:MAG: putative toxin-antitoxin system toxin component, PIN family [Actinobacteria bacterium]|nr:putative toxin-antitoxin system toxin component, PIN family [Actinomycetota bacterium]
MKIFLDANVIISAFITHGHAAELVEYCLIHHKIYTSDFIIKEVKRNLKEKFNFNDKEINEVINFIKSNFINVGKYKRLNKKISNDPDDDNVLAAAIFEKVDCIVTGDKDLLIIKKFEDIKILSPKDFWKFEKFSEE